MNETEAQLFARLKEEDTEFRRLADKHREFDRKIMELDRIYYLTSEQERKRKELQKLKLKIKDEMYAIMQRHMQAQNASIVSSGSPGPSQDGGYQRKG
ncbi:MAG: YdcH family protein [Candidatus Methylomirabilales bacterium]